MSNKLSQRIERIWYKSSFGRDDRLLRTVFCNATYISTNGRRLSEDLPAVGGKDSFFTTGSTGRFSAESGTASGYCRTIEGSGKNGEKSRCYRWNRNGPRCKGRRGVVKRDRIEEYPDLF